MKCELPASKHLAANSLGDHYIVLNHSQNCELDWKPTSSLLSGGWFPARPIPKPQPRYPAALWAPDCDTTTISDWGLSLNTPVWPDNKVKSCVLIRGRYGGHFESGYSPWAPNQSCSWVSLEQREASEGAPRSTRGMLLAVLASLLNKHARHAWSFRGTASSIRQYVHMKYCVFSMWSLHK